MRSRPAYLSGVSYGAAPSQDRGYGLPPSVIKPLDLSAAAHNPEVLHIPNWDRLTDPQRVAILRRIAEEAGRDPRIAALASRILQQAGCDQRQYDRQAAALLKWVQNNILYVNESGEILQDPLYTLKRRAGDCDDVGSLYGALCSSLGIPWKYVLSGTDRKGHRARWVEGTRLPHGVTFSHIYNLVGWPPFRPEVWAVAECTVKGSPLGYEPAMTGRLLPEMGGPQNAGGGTLGALGVPNYGYPVSVMSTTQAASTASSFAILKEMDWKYIASATVVGVATSVLGQILIDAVRAWSKAKVSKGA